jgi:N-acetylneuraminic acid mutarotase
LAHQVFLSHATEDRETAVQVCAALEAEGISCWIAPRDVAAGADYAVAILEAIQASELVVLIFSADANASPYVLREIDRAVAYKRPVLALRVDDTSPNTSIEYYVHAWRRFEATTGVEKKQDELVTAVREALGTARSAGNLSPDGGRKAATSGRWLRQKWWIALASAVVLVAAGLALGLGLTRGDAASGNVVTDGQVRWTNLSPSGSLPIARYGQAMGNDPTSGRLIMFGGCAENPDGAGTFLNDLSAYDLTTNTWTELDPSGARPSARIFCTMTYDPRSRRLIVFGGRDGTTRLNDTWAYDPIGNTWTELRPSGALPVARGGHAMAYDPSQGVMIMFGGRSGEASFLGDTWAYDPAGNTWTELKPAGDLPPVRGQPAMAYDPTLHRMIVFGGWDLESELNDTWAYDPAGNTWTELKPAGGLPPVRAGHSLVYDPSRGLPIMFGGSAGPSQDVTCFSDTWAYHSATNTWTQFDAFEGVTPAARTGQSLVFDPSGDRLILFGGAPPEPQDFNDTWACDLQLP